MKDVYIEGLIKLRNEESRSLALLKKRLKEFGKPIDRRDEVSNEMEVTIEQIRQKNMVLQAIGDALELAKNGKYGCCADCGDPISWERLKVVLFATRCMACQESLEDANKDGASYLVHSALHV